MNTIFIFKQFLTDYLAIESYVLFLNTIKLNTYILKRWASKESSSWIDLRFWCVYPSSSTTAALLRDTTNSHRIHRRILTTRTHHAILEEGEMRIEILKDEIEENRELDLWFRPFRVYTNRRRKPSFLFDSFNSDSKRIKETVFVYPLQSPLAQWQKPLPLNPSTRVRAVGNPYF